MSKIDIRVDVPEGCAVSAVYAQPGSNCMAQVRLPILGYFAPPDPKHTFEIGKRYRTRGGWVTGPLKDCDNISYPLMADGGASVMCGAGVMSSWTLCGKYSLTGHNAQYDLMPGAIEDEPKAYEAVSEEARPGKSVLVSKDTFDAMKEEISTARREIAVLASGMNNQSQRINERMRADDRALSNHNERLRNLQDRITEVDALPLRNMLIRIETIETWVREGDLRTRHERLCKTVDDLLKHLGLKIGDYGRLAPVEPPKPNGGAFDCLVSKPSERIKPTIKGGWVNVYRDGRADKTIFCQPAYETKREADETAGTTRLACIHIPDITEGEGL